MIRKIQEPAADDVEHGGNKDRRPGKGKGQGHGTGRATTMPPGPKSH